MVKSWTLKAKKQFTGLVDYRMDSGIETVFTAVFQTVQGLVSLKSMFKGQEYMAMGTAFLCLAVWFIVNIFGMCGTCVHDVMSLHHQKGVNQLDDTLRNPKFQQ